MKTMKEKDGVGLAAPQVGQNIRLIAVNTKDGVACMINPKITKKSWAKEWSEEGCLSVPGVYGQVKRHKKINCVYLDKNGAKIKIQAEGLMAVVIQHETDHLDGILFIDKAKKLKKVESI
jgi:peptide deformylase